MQAQMPATSVMKLFSMFSNEDPLSSEEDKQYRDIKDLTTRKQGFYDGIIYYENIFIINTYIYNKKIFS